MQKQYIDLELYHLGMFYSAFYLINAAGVGFYGVRVEFKGRDLRCNVFDCMLPEPTSDRNKLKYAILSKLTRKIYLVKVPFPPCVADHRQLIGGVREMLEAHIPRAGLHKLSSFLSSH